MEKSLPPNTIIKFTCTSTIRGTGKIVGISNTGIPGIGIGYIVEILSSEGIDKAVYPYTHMTVFASQIEVA